VEDKQRMLVGLLLLLLLLLILLPSLLPWLPLSLLSKRRKVYGSSADTV